MKPLVVMAWMLACIAAAPAPPAAPATRAADAEAKEFAAFGVAVEAPAGWTRAPEVRPGMIARWTNQTPTRRANAGIALELEPANGRTLAQFTETVRKSQRNGDIGIHALVMGGQPAMLVTGQSPDSHSAVHILITLNDKYFYLLNGIAPVPGLLPTEAIGQIARTMSFMPIADPAVGVALREPVVYFDRFKISLLATMRPEDEPPPARTLYLCVIDYRAGRALRAEIQLVNNAARTPLVTFAQQITKHMSPGAPVPWGVTAAAPLRAVSAPFEFVNSDGNRVHTRVGLVQLNDTELLLLNFFMDRERPETRAALESACEKIVMSVTPIGK